MQLVSIHKNENDPEAFEILLEDTLMLQDEELHQNLSLQKLEKALASLQSEFLAM